MCPPFFHQTSGSWCKLCLKTGIQKYSRLIFSLRVNSMGTFLVQWLSHLPRDLEVVGSIPRWGNFFLPSFAYYVFIYLPSLQHMNHFFADHFHFLSSFLQFCVKSMSYFYNSLKLINY